MVFVMYPVGGYYVEDGLPAAGAGGSGACAQRTPDSAGIGHYPKGDGGAGCSVGPGPCSHCYWREEPALCKCQTDPSLGGGALQEEETV